MSLSYCNMCEQIVEGNTYMIADEDGEEYTLCAHCDTRIIEVEEDGYHKPEDRDG